MASQDASEKIGASLENAKIRLLESGGDGVVRESTLRVMEDLISDMDISQGQRQQLISKAKKDMSEYQARGYIEGTIKKPGVTLGEVAALEIWLEEYEHKDELDAKTYQSLLKGVKKYVADFGKDNGAAFNNQIKGAVHAAITTGDSARLEIGGVRLSEELIRQSSLPPDQKIKRIEDIKTAQMALGTGVVQSIGDVPFFMLERQLSQAQERANISVLPTDQALAQSRAFEKVRSVVRGAREEYKKDPVRHILEGQKSPRVNALHLLFSNDPTPANFAAYSQAIKNVQKRLDPTVPPKVLTSETVDIISEQLRGTGDTAAGPAQANRAIQELFTQMQGQSWMDVVNQLEQEGVLTGGLFVAATLAGNRAPGAGQLSLRAIEVSKLNGPEFVQTFAKGDASLMKAEKMKALNAIEPLVEAMKFANVEQRARIQASFTSTMARIKMLEDARGRDYSYSDMAKILMPKFTGQGVFGSDIVLQVPRNKSDAEVDLLEKGLVRAREGLGKRKIYVAGAEGVFSNEDLVRMSRPTFVNVGEDHVKVVDHLGSDMQEVAKDGSLRPIIFHIDDVISDQQAYEAELERNEAMRRAERAKRAAAERRRAVETPLPTAAELGRARARTLRGQ